MTWINLDLATLMLVAGGLVVLGLSVSRWWRQKKRLETTFIRRQRNYRSYLKVEMVLMAFLILVGVLVGVSIWGPEWGEKQVRSEVTGADVMFVLDVSKSMQAVDMNNSNEGKDRLTLAKSMMMEYVVNNPENRYGLVVFAGDAFVSSPLTFDNQAFVTFAQGVSYRDVGEQGTNLEEALSMSLGRFGKDEEERGRVMVLISDGGEDIEGNYGKLAEVIAEEGIKVMTVGIGSEKGVPIPEGKDMFGRDVYKTYRGEQVMTKLNDKPLRDIAEITGGEYVHAKKVEDMNKVSQVLERVEQSTLLKSEGTKKENRYQWLLLPALVLFTLIISWPIAISMKEKI